MLNRCPLVRALTVLAAVAAGTGMAAHAQPRGPLTLTLRTFDVHGQPLLGERLEWWRIGEPHRKQVQTCPHGSCAAWTLALDPPFPARLQGFVSKSFPDDPECWNGCMAELAVDTDTGGDAPREARAQLVHHHAACASPPDADPAPSR